MNVINNLLQQHQKGWSLQGPFYTDEKVLECEMNAIWKYNWLFAGFACEIPAAGDFFTYSIINQSVIIIRDDDGIIYAHHNTCRHRGSAICLEDRGNEPNLKCPYHSWTYEKNGNLKSARLMPDDFDKKAFGLHPVHVKLIEGVIFISLADTPPDFTREATDLAPYLRPFAINNAKVAYRDRYELDANWKLICENFRECYHCGPVHIEYCNAVVGANLVEDSELVAVQSRKNWEEDNLPHELISAVENTAHYAIRYPLRPGMKSYTLDGKPAAPLMGTHKQYNTGVVGLVTYPNFWMDGVSDYIWAMRITPIDATHSVVDLTWLVNENAEEGKDYDLDRLTEFWKITGEQDWHLCENNQKGINSSKYGPGPLAPSEIDVSNFHEWYIKTVTKCFNPATF